MIAVEGFKAFSGEMLITPKNPNIKPFTAEGNWLYKPDTKCWYGKGSSYPEAICTPMEYSPGMDVWCLDRIRPDGRVTGLVRGTVIAVAPGALVISAADYENLNSILTSHYEETLVDGNTALLVFPVSQCFRTEELAMETLKNKIENTPVNRMTAEDTSVAIGYAVEVLTQESKCSRYTVKGLDLVEG